MNRETLGHRLAIEEGDKLVAVKPTGGPIGHLIDKRLLNIRIVGVPLADMPGMPQDALAIGTTFGGNLGLGGVGGLGGVSGQAGMSGIVVQSTK